MIWLNQMVLYNNLLLFEVPAGAHAHKILNIALRQTARFKAGRWFSYGCRRKHIGRPLYNYA